MLVEAATSLTTLFLAPEGVERWETWLAAALLAAVWASTAILQVPQHRRLERGFDAEAHRRLVRTNWIRVAGWSFRALLLLDWVL